MNLLVCSIGQSQITWVTTTIDDTIPGTLRYALNHASMGDDIRFADSLFANGSQTIVVDSTLRIGKAISLRGYMRQGDTLFISGNNNSKVFDIDLDYASRSNGVLLIDSLAVIDGVDLIGGGMEIHYIGVTTISNSYFRNNSSTYAGSALHSSVLGNNVQAEIRLENNLFVQNTGPEVVFVQKMKGIELENIICRNNTTPSSIQAITSVGGKLVASKLYAIDNHYGSSSFGKMQIHLGADTIYTDSLFALNNNGSGGFKFFRAWVQHHKNLYAIGNNQSAGSSALHLWWNSSGGEPPLLENCVFKNNQGKSSAIYIASATFKNCLIRGNITDLQFYGYGAIECSHNSIQPLSFIDCVIDSNTTVTGMGGAIYGNPQRLYLERVSINQNAGDVRGGGIYLVDCDTLTILNSYIGDNTATEDAGVRIPQGTVAYIKNSTICHNVATQGSGGLHFEGSLEMGGSLIAHNVPTNLTGTGSPFPAIISTGYNMIAQGFGYRINGLTTTDIFNPSAANTVMSPLGNYGGIGLTRIPLAGNRAIDLGNPADSSLPFNDSIINGRRDIGAVENNDSILKSYSEIEICDSTEIGGTWVSRTPVFLLTLR